MRTLFAALALLALPLQSQPAAPAEDARVAWLADHAIRMRTLDASEDDFGDLEPLRATLKGVRVVMLGEQSHGDGTAFVAKTRLIRFLHERMGFDVLAFESGFYDCPKAWDFVREGEPARKSVPRGVFAIWTGSREVQPVIDYIGAQAKSAHPLELAGVDSQLTASASVDFLAGDLAAFLSCIDPKLAQGDDWNRVARVIDRLYRSAWENGTEPVPAAEEQEEFARTIESWRSAIATHDRTPATQPWSGAFWRQFLASLRGIAEQTWSTRYPDFAGNPEVFAMRDRQMGENLAWLATQRYPNRKIIVWAATFHNARNLGTIETHDEKYRCLYAATSPMGEVAWKTLGSELYSLGVTSYEGESATPFTPNGKPLPATSRDSLEDLCARAGLVNAIVDFRYADSLRAPLEGRLMGHVEMRADWTRIVDGVLFLRTMQRSHRYRP